MMIECSKRRQRGAGVRYGYGSTGWVLHDFKFKIRGYRSSEVFANSPFFITAEEAGALEARKSDEHKEVSVPAGKTHEDVKFTFLNKTLSSESEVDRSNEVEDVKFDAQLIDRMKQLSEESAECRKAVERLRQTRRDSG
ncbi:hypothetical protein FXO38_06749 [Capsicum annuum]|nr:hypothetical protein FXO38_06749 [Capsicum annuum]